MGVPGPVTGSGDPAVVPRRMRTFGLSSLLLIIAVLGVSFGVMRKSLGLGIPMVIILTPACIRACRVAAQRRERGQPMGPAEATQAFLGSVGVMTAISTAATAAFVGTCLPVGYVMFMADPAGLYIACLIGGIIGLYAGYVTLCRLWPWKE